MNLPIRTALFAAIAAFAGLASMAQVPTAAAQAAIDAEAKKILNAKPDGLELVLTGRGAPEDLMELADYVTEIRMIKHPFQKGVKARKGIEF